MTDTKRIYLRIIYMDNINMYIKGRNKMKEKEMFQEIAEVLKVLAHPVRLSLVKIMLAKVLLM